MEAWDFFGILLITRKICSVMAFFFVGMSNMLQLFFICEASGLVGFSGSPRITSRASTPLQLLVNIQTFPRLGRCYLEVRLVHLELLSIPDTINSYKFPRQTAVQTQHVRPSDRPSSTNFCTLGNDWSMGFSTRGHSFGTAPTMASEPRPFDIATIKAVWQVKIGG
jgi:hypothetical protein